MGGVKTLPWKLLPGLTLLGLFGPALLLLAGGDPRWPAGWAYSIFGFLYTVLGRFALFARTPDLAAERASGIRRDEVPSWDRKIVPWIGVLLPSLTMVAAGFDHRWGGAPHFPLWLRVASAAPMVAGALLGLWAALNNPFFSSVSRLQPDRGQYVVTSGPYRVVRHPGYAGGLAFMFFTPLFLGSLWALAPMAVDFGLSLLRTRLEDRMLREKMEGYRDYASRTRYRLIPGLW